MSFINVHRPTTDAGGQLQIKNLALLNIYTDDRSRPTLAVGVSENTIYVMACALYTAYVAVSTVWQHQWWFRASLMRRLRRPYSSPRLSVMPWLCLGISLAVFPGHS